MRKALATQLATSLPSVFFQHLCHVTTHGRFRTTPGTCSPSTGAFREHGPLERLGAPKEDPDSFPSSTAAIQGLGFRVFRVWRAETGPCSGSGPTGSTYSRILRKYSGNPDAARVHAKSPTVLPHCLGNNFMPLHKYTPSIDPEHYRD